MRAAGPPTAQSHVLLILARLRTKLDARLSTLTPPGMPGRLQREALDTAAENLPAKADGTQ